jgi:hypothetical protein
MFVARLSNGCWPASVTRCATNGVTARLSGMKTCADRTRLLFRTSSSRGGWQSSSPDSLWMPNTSCTRSDASHRGDIYQSFPYAYAYGAIGSDGRLLHLGRTEPSPRPAVLTSVRGSFGAAPPSSRAGSRPRLDPRKTTSRARSGEGRERDNHDPVHGHGAIRAADRTLRRPWTHTIVSRAQRKSCDPRRRYDSRTRHTGCRLSVDVLGLRCTM